MLQIQRVGVGEQVAQPVGDRGAILVADADVDRRCGVRLFCHRSLLESGPDFSLWAKRRDAQSLAAIVAIALCGVKTGA